MSGFLISTKCSGRRPKKAMLARHYERPHLMAQLLQERHVPRYLVAPTGFGKSSVVYEYAATMFRFEHVFWIDAKSPCFLRDLDAEVIALTLLGLDDQDFLVVFEDIPHLHSERVRLFLSQIDKLLKHHAEVLITCTPAHDSFEGHLDRLKISSDELLLTSEEENELLVHPEVRAVLSSSTFTSRVPQLAWGGSCAHERFLEAVAHEEVPNEVLCSLFLLFSIQSGNISDLSQFACVNESALHHSSELYPSVISVDSIGNFDSFRFDFEQIMKAFSPILSKSGVGGFASEDNEDALAMINVLIERRDYERACIAARYLLCRPERAKWLAKNGTHLLNGACIEPAHKVFESLGEEHAAFGSNLRAAEVLRSAALGELSTTIRQAECLFNSRSVPHEIRALMGLVLARSEQMDDSEQLRTWSALLAHKNCEEMSGNPSVCCKEHDAFDEYQLCSSAELIVLLATHEAERTSARLMCETWMRAVQQGVRGAFIFLGALWVLERTLADIEAQAPYARENSVEFTRFLELLISLMLEEEVSCCSLFAARAGNAALQALRAGLISSFDLPEDYLNAYREIELSLFDQRKNYLEGLVESTELAQVWEETHPSLSRPVSRRIATPAILDQTPLLTVNVFGGLEVYIGSDRVDPRLFSRRKVKTLLALLVLNKGREFSRDKLVELLWPESDIESARRNFYGIWSLLRQALTTKAGTCPYLVRQQQSLRIEASLLRSDVQQLDELCRTLLFEQPEYGGWAQLFAQVSELYSNDILPSESDNSALAGRRRECRDRLVDALVSASARLVRAGEVREGLWFARAALQHDEEREDVYIALMEAQIKSGQRAAALETYFACRRYLSSELGIDPAPETIRLYESIIQ